jgi:uncharacterized protein (DUF305 family)
MYSDCMDTQHTRRYHVPSIRWVSSAALIGVLAACGQPATTTNSSVPSASNAAASTDHSGHGGTAGDAATDAPFDAQFIDGMIPHHEGAVTMAQEALTQAERPEVKQLAQQIIDAQEQEVAQMQAWRRQWYGDLALTGGMSIDMGAMTISQDTSKPFDQRFLEAMIKHHESAITMAQEAQTEAEHGEVRELATQIVADQQREIDQMQQWLQQWYGG